MSRQTDTDKLQKYLDQQISTFANPQLQRPTFDHIENKLLKIEQKLLGLKTLSQNKLTNAFAQQTSSFYPSANYSIKSSQVELSPSKKQASVQIKQEASPPVWTPPKQLNLVSKTMSAGHLGPPFVNMTIKKEKKKANSTAKKKEIKTHSFAYLGGPKENKYKNTPTKSTLRKGNSLRDADRQVHFLKREIQQHEKTNADLRKRVNELKGYQTEFCKLKQIFDRCEQLRRRTRKNRNQL